MRPSFLFGSNLFTLFKLGIQHRFRFSIRYLPRLISHLPLAIWNSIFSLIDLFFPSKGDATNVVFILGHYRSGTTHLLNVLSADGQLIPPSTYQALFPDSFLSTEKWMSPFFNRIGPRTRAMDNMAMRMENPQEEEIALAAMGAPTPYLAAQFPITGVFYRDCLSFENADKKAIRRFETSHLRFTRKLIKKHGKNATLLLKSPGNTSRIPILLKIYPKAKFVFIHRDPYKTVQSTLHLYDTWYKMASFQSIHKLKENVGQTALKVYVEMNEKWLQDQHMIPEDRITTISFRSLQEDPTSTVQHIYQKLDLSPLNKPKLEEYLASISNYSKNTYKALSQEMINRINNQCKFIFDIYNYNMKELKDIK